MAYYGIAIPVGLLNKDSTYLRQPLFWIKSALLISIIGLNNGYYLFPNLIKSIDQYALQIFAYRISSGLKGFVFYLIPILLIKYIFDRKEKHIYGLTSTGFDYKPYLYLLLLITPFIIGASFQSTFRAQYPFFKAWRFGEIAGLAVWQTTTIYEILYGISFIFLEWVFRGALILGLVVFMGKKTILPMVATYAFLHFGKPLPETISSIFGGYILGVIALYSRSVFGGCLIHIGIAYLMDFSAIVQHYFGQD